MVARSCHQRRGTTGELTKRFSTRSNAVLASATAWARARSLADARTTQTVPSLLRLAVGRGILRSSAARRDRTGPELGSAAAAAVDRC